MTQAMFESCSHQIGTGVGAEGHWAPSLSPPATAPVLMTLVALAAQVGRLFLQEILECFDPRQQTEG